MIWYDAGNMPITSWYATIPLPSVKTNSCEQSKKKRQHNGQKKKDKRINNDIQNIHIKLKIGVYYEEFEDTKVVMRIRISNKDRLHNGQKKKDKSSNNDLQNIILIMCNYFPFNTMLTRVRVSHYNTTFYLVYLVTMQNCNICFYSYSIPP